jgi:serine/threonine protein kinase/WD40 repeat protein
MDNTDRWSKVEELFHAALAQPQGERAEFLRHACADDSQLRNEVQGLIERAAPGDSFLEGSPLFSTETRPPLLSPSRTVGNFQILELIGRGGMGEVYRARDTRLARDVALKVLPDRLARNPDALARFEREAKVLASLNHPNIAQIYGVEDGALVMEFVEGESPKGLLPFDEAWEIASQIAEGLEYAHEKGVVHRDLKPANVKITHEGVVKLLDFGLAKAFSDPTDEPAHSPAINAGATVPGMILGTAAYMAPEQARGKKVDQRADIWAWGVTLYELLTCERLFKGDDVAATLVQVLTKEPDFERVPPQVRRVLQECLEKDPKQRLAAIGDAKKFVVSDRPVSPRSGRRLRNLGWVAAAATAVVALGVSFVHFRETAQRVLRLSVAVPDDIAPAGFLLLSPDGRRLAISGFSEGKYGIWLRSLDSQQLKRLSGTDGTRNAFWSPDGRNLGFFADGKLKIISVNGGPPQTLCNAGLFSAGTWNSDGVILFETEGSLEQVRVTGGECKQLFRAAGEIGHSYPAFLPDGKHFLYTVHRVEEAKRGIYLASLDQSEGRRLLPDDSSVVFAPKSQGGKHDHLLFLRDTTLIAQPFNAETLQLAGDAFPIAAHATKDLNDVVAASASANGLLAYVSNPAGNDHQLTWLDRRGNELEKVGPRTNLFSAALAPDAKTAAIARPQQGLWLLDLTRNVESRFTFPPLGGAAPVWSPDGSRIVFSSGNDLYVKNANGGGREEALLKNGNLKRATDWSRDGRYLLYTENNPKTGFDIWYLPNPLSPANDKKPVPYLRTEFREGRGQFSPDGRWVAYESEESGRREVYVRPFPSGAGKRRISSNGGGHPRWRGDGRELFYLQSLSPFRSRLMVVPIQPRSNQVFESGAPKLLFEFPAELIAEVFPYSPAPDGQRFLVKVQAGNSQPILNIVTGWEKDAASPPKGTGDEQ